MNTSHASRIKRQVLLNEVVRLKALIPPTEATLRNIRAIETANPPKEMSDSDLSSYIDLLYRSVPWENV